MTRRLRPLGRLADLFVFAPLGLLLEAPRLLPELAETGRRTLLGCRAARSTAERAATGLGRGLLPASSGPAGADGEAGAVDPEQEIVITVEREDEPDGNGVDSDGPDADALPIPGYDQLAASQVIARLPGLTRSELDRIEDHEVAHRHRRTVLAKISQLRA